LTYHLIVRGEKIRFMCVRCGTCCSTGPNVALTIYDICRIARFLGVDWRDLRGKYIVAYIADMIPVPALRGLGDKCAFLTFDDGLPYCSIYPARPMRCKLYPFLPISPSKPDALYVANGCLGVGEGEPVDPPWDTLNQYYAEVKEHYALLYKLIFEEGYEPLQALEAALDKVCKEELNSSI